MRPPPCAPPKGQPEGGSKSNIVQGGHSRNTAWYAMVREDWDAAAPRLDAFLGPAGGAAALYYVRRAAEVAKAAASPPCAA